MGIKLGVWALILLLIPMSVFAAAEISANPFITNTGTSTIDVNAAFTVMKEDLKAEINAYNDDNLRILDQRISIFLENQSKTLVLSLLGVNLLVSGLIYFFIIRNTRKISYDSISMRRKKEEEDRQYVADSINYVRERTDWIETMVSNKIEPSLMTLQQMVEQMNMRQNYEQQKQGSGAGFDQYSRSQGVGQHAMETSRDVAVFSANQAGNWGSYEQQVGSRQQSSYGGFSEYRQ